MKRRLRSKVNFIMCLALKPSLRLLYTHIALAILSFPLSEFSQPKKKRTSAIWPFVDSCHEGQPCSTTQMIDSSILLVLVQDDSLHKKTSLTLPLPVKRLAMHCSQSL